MWTYKVYAPEGSRFNVADHAFLNRLCVEGACKVFVNKDVLTLTSGDSSSPNPFLLKLLEEFKKEGLKVEAQA